MHKAIREKKARNIVMATTITPETTLVNIMFSRRDSKTREATFIVKEKQKRTNERIVFHTNAIL